MKSKASAPQRIWTASALVWCRGCSVFSEEPGARDVLPRTPEPRGSGFFERDELRRTAFSTSYIFLRARFLQRFPTRVRNASPFFGAQAPQPALCARSLTEGLGHPRPSDEVR